MTAQTEQRSVVLGTPAVTSVARPTPSPQLVTTTGGRGSERQSTAFGQPAPRHAKGFPDRLSGPRGQRARSPRRTAEHSKRAPPPHKVVHHMTEPILEATGLSRSFGHVRALDAADFDIYPGEVVAVIGDNGAGKSTLVKALTGNLALDTGEIKFEGKPVHITSPQQASALGMEVVYQDLALAPHLNPVQNMFLGREVSRKGVLGHLGFMDEKTMREKAKQSFAELGGTVRSMSAPIGSMSGGQRQQVAIARAISWADKVVILDEPTAALGVVQTQNVLDSIKRVKAKGIAVILISHSMPHVLEVADRVQVLRLGRRVATFDASKTTVEELVGAMTGALDKSGEAA
jgi:simple sugar transport system ATP-binding protein